MGQAACDPGCDPAPRRVVWVYCDNLRATIFSAPTLKVTSALRDAGWRVDLLVGGNVPAPRVTDLDGVEICEFPRPEIFLVKQVIYHVSVLRYILREWGSVDVVFFMPMSLPWMLLLRTLGMLPRPRVMAASPARRSRRPRPLLVMDTRTLPMVRSTPRDRVRSLYMDAMNRLANRFADGQTTITPALAQAYRMPSEKLWGIWPSGVDTALFAPAIQKRRWPEGDDPVRMIFVGSLEAEKPLLPLCAAIQAAGRDGMRFELSFVGDGPSADGIAKMARQSGGAIRFLGRVPHEQVPDVLATAHLGVLASPDTIEYRVESPIKLFEYLGAGLPVLASRVSCHTEVVGEQPCAFWIDGVTTESFLKALRQVWAERHTLAARGAQAHELAPAYSWTAAAQKLAQALEHGLTHRGR